MWDCMNVYPTGMLFTVPCFMMRTVSTFSLTELYPSVEGFACTFAF